MDINNLNHKLEEIIQLTVEKQYVIDDSILLRDLIKSDEVVLYGGGRIGKLVFEKLKKQGRIVKAFLDKNAEKDQCYNNVPFYKANEYASLIEIDNDISIILCVFLSDEDSNLIIKELRSFGFKNIIYSKELLACYCKYALSQEEPINYYKYKDKINKIFGLLADQLSLELFVANLQAYATWNFDSVIENKNMIQYFKVNIPFSKGCSHFVDCGAFTGDSIQSLLKYLNCNSYFGFEPDMSNFKLLKNNMKLINEKLDEIIIFPSAVSNKTGYAYFNQIGNDNSCLSDSNLSADSMPVSIVKLDDVIQKSKITMIKMDIEGAEIDAVNGAKNIITNQKPDLAICVYHKISDIWEIPTILHEWVPEYKFYLRCHGILTTETVLYATI